MVKKYVLIFIIFLSIILNSCHHRLKAEEVIIGEDQIDFSIWISYWALDDLDKELEKTIHKINHISYFASYFNKDEELFIPEEIIGSLEKVKEQYRNRKSKDYLSFVNDLILEDGTSSLKDTDLLYRLFEDEGTMDQHIKDIINISKTNGFHGIEIDYEGIKTDMDLWDLFRDFISRLYEETSPRNLPLRIVLEPNAPLELIDLVQGPEYVLMCYNLHGQGTLPGPKADLEFLDRMIEKADNLPGQVNFALATGGYDFGQEGQIKALTEKEVRELLAIYNQDPLRDSRSQAMYFDYIDQDNLFHEVWYADAITIRAWIDHMEKAGYNKISLWKLGGNLDIEDILINGEI